MPSPVDGSKWVSGPLGAHDDNNNNNNNVTNLYSAILCMHISMRMMNENVGWQVLGTCFQKLLVVKELPGFCQGPTAVESSPVRQHAPAGELPPQRPGCVYVAHAMYHKAKQQVLSEAPRHFGRPYNQSRGGAGRKKRLARRTPFCCCA